MMNSVFNWFPLRKKQEASDVPLRLGIIPVSVELLEEMLAIPSGYRIVGLSYDEVQRTLNLMVMSPELPEAIEGEPLPHLLLIVTVHTSEVFPDHRRIETTIALPPKLGG